MEWEYMKDLIFNILNWFDYPLATGYFLKEELETLGKKEEFWENYVNK